MTVWLVLEENWHVLRADSIVSIAAIPVRANDDHTDWSKIRPADRIHPSRPAQIVVATGGGEQGVAMSCVGRDAAKALLGLLQLLARIDSERRGQVKFIQGRRRDLSQATPWQVTDEMPDPEQAYRS